jgi:hypothetical protein
VGALRLFRWLLPALAIPACAAAVGVAFQAAVFGRASEDSLVATQAVRQLVRYHVMRGTESVAGRSLGTTCIQGWFRVPGHRRLLRGALVLFSNGERLYDVGHGVRRLRRNGPIGRSLPADPEDRARFVLAACPHYLGDHFATELVRGRAVETVDRRADGVEAAAIVVGSRRRSLTLDVRPVTYKPIALSFQAGRLSGWSDLVPGGGVAEIRRVRRAFDLPLGPKHSHA